MTRLELRSQEATLAIYNVFLNVIIIVVGNGDGYFSCVISRRCMLSRAPLTIAGHFLGLGSDLVGYNIPTVHPNL